MDDLLSAAKDALERQKRMPGEGTAEWAAWVARLAEEASQLPDPLEDAAGEWEVTDMRTVKWNREQTVYLMGRLGRPCP